MHVETLDPENQRVCQVLLAAISIRAKLTQSRQAILKSIHTLASYKYLILASYI